MSHLPFCHSTALQTSFNFIKQYLLCLCYKLNYIVSYKLNYIVSIQHFLSGLLTLIWQLVHLCCKIYWYFMTVSCKISLYEYNAFSFIYLWGNILTCAIINHDRALMSKLCKNLSNYPGYIYGNESVESFAKSLFNILKKRDNLKEGAIKVYREICH